MGADAIWPALVLIPALALATATDLRHRTVSNRLNLATAALALALGLLLDPASVPGRAAAAAAAGGTLGALAWARPQGMGMGDAKLAAAMGLCLGPRVIVALLAAFSLGALAGAALILRHGARARRRTIPFAPFLGAGGLVALAWGSSLLDWYLGT
jgi:prepilin signal peptidase PulO-like enzyme (type II secretory pathway)